MLCPCPRPGTCPYGSTKPVWPTNAATTDTPPLWRRWPLLLEKDENILRPVYLIFQSAEETGKGGKSCADFVEAAGLGEVYAFHNLSGYPENAIMVRDDLTQCASKGLTFRFTGKRAHAGTPEEGNNPCPGPGEADSVRPGHGEKSHHRSLKDPAAHPGGAERGREGFWHFSR